MRFTKPAVALSVLVMALSSTTLSTAFAQEKGRTAGSTPAQSADTQTDDNSVENTSETYQELNLFGDVFERVRAQYVEKEPDEKLIENALNGMLSSLDPHSSYLNNKDFGDMQVQTKGEFGGLGIEVTMDNGLIKVVSPIDDTPAAKAGVQSGDYITEIDGEPVMGLTLSEAVDKMRGPVSTDINITIHRKGEQDPIKLTLTRDVIQIQSARSEEFKDSVGYIRITSFSQNTESGVKKAVKDIKEKLGDNLKGYVIDLRNNPGGLLNQAIAVSDLFLDKGEIVSTRGRNKEDIKRDNATPGDVADGKPIVILINGGTASAAEIVSGALKDHRRAILLGERSFGKGSVQTVIPIPGHGAIRLTTARYYTPSGVSIQAKGIEPDIEVEQAKIEDIKVDRYREADLRGALKNENDNKKPANTKAAKDAKDAKTPDNAKGDKTGEESNDADGNAQSEVEQRAAQDYQLSRAIDLIRGVSLYEARNTTDSVVANDNADGKADAAQADDKKADTKANGDKKAADTKPDTKSDSTE